MAELAWGVGLSPIGNNSAPTRTPLENFEARLTQLEKQELRPINHNLVHYRDFMFVQ
jgi:hypothetical protein